MQYELSNYETAELRSMFPELIDHSPAEVEACASYNDGGRIVTTIWEGPGGWYQTRHSEYGVASPWTTIQKVERKLEKRYVIVPAGPRHRYGDLGAAS